MNGCIDAAWEVGMASRLIVFCAAALVVAAGFVALRPADAGEVPLTGYKVLAPIHSGNLTVFPVVAAKTHATNEFLTLDEGLRSGEVVVTESGMLRGLQRRPHTGVRPSVWHERGDDAQVNRLVLVNNSKRPLLLLAGEIVTGGKQDRVIGKDRIVPAESDPIDLGVFCVEPGRWVATSEKFGNFDTAMASPKVRAGAMADKNQQKVWDEVRSSQHELAAVLGRLPAPSPAAQEIGRTSSYARVMQNSEVKKQVDSVAAPIEQGYASVIRQLKDQNAVGIVVAVNGELIWADVFASPQLLEKYWPKLVRSYAAEAVVTRTSKRKLTVDAAQDFLDQLEGRREVSESEPGLFRQTEISGDGYRVFELTSLLPKTGFDLHIAKMAE
jgi:ARG/rhodanese/phosphatase superfamily protein